MSHYYLFQCRFEPRTYEGKALVLITGETVFSRTPFSVLVTQSQFEMLINGTPPDIVLGPGYPPEEVEFLISGMGGPDFLEPPPDEEDGDGPGLFDDLLDSKD